MTGKTLGAAAAAAGMSERTARRWQSGALPSTAKGPRTWRTREDPFGDVWETEVVPQLVADTEGRLQVLTLFRELCRRHPGRFEAGQLRTLQRRVREWRAQDGPDREVYFEQVAVPGREAAFDFTDASSLGVTIRGEAFRHLLFEWVLSYSRWTYVSLALSETFEALVAGLQGALWTLGAVPAVLRHDNLSAATHELKRSGGRQLTVLNTGVEQRLDVAPRPAAEDAVPHVQHEDVVPPVPIDVEPGDPAGASRKCPPRVPRTTRTGNLARRSVADSDPSFGWPPTIRSSRPSRLRSTTARMRLTREPVGELRQRAQAGYLSAWISCSPVGCESRLTQYSGITSPPDGLRRRPPSAQRGYSRPAKRSRDGRNAAPGCCRRRRRSRRPQRRS